MNDTESESLTYTGSITPDPGWITFTQNSTHLIGQGTPSDNAHATTYNFTVMTTDPYTDVADHNWTAAFTIIKNDPPAIGTMENKSLLAPDGITWSYGTVLSSDPEGLTYTKGLEVNGSSSIPNWLTYDLSNFTFSVVTTSNANKGDHTITVIVTDDYNIAVKKSMTLTINENMAPQRNKFIPNYGIVNYNLLTIEFEAIDVMFTDPDNRTMTPKLVQGNGDPLPSFLEYNSVSNTLSGTPFSVHVGEWPISYVAIDDHALESNITFKISVNRKCYNLVST